MELDGRLSERIRRNSGKHLRSEFRELLIETLREHLFMNPISRFQKMPNEELARYCETLFDILDVNADSKKGRPSIWSLQLLMLVLSPVSVP